MHDNRTRKIVEFRTEGALQPFLHAVSAAPRNALEEGIEDADDHRRGDELRIESGTFSNAAGDDGRHRCREGEQEEELYESVAALLRELAGAHVEADTVGDRVAHEEICDGRDREVAEYLDEAVHLVLRPHRAEFEKRKAGVHGEHHDGAHEYEEDIGTGFDRLHLFSPLLDKRDSRKQA